MFKIRILKTQDIGRALLFPTTSEYSRWKCGEIMDYRLPGIRIADFAVGNIYTVNAFVRPDPYNSADTPPVYAVREYERPQFHYSADVQYQAWAIPQNHFMVVP